MSLRPGIDPEVAACLSCSSPHWSPTCAAAWCMSGMWHSQLQASRPAPTHHLQQVSSALRPCRISSYGTGSGACHGALIVCASTAGSLLNL